MLELRKQKQVFLRGRHWCCWGCLGGAVRLQFGRELVRRLRRQWSWKMPLRIDPKGKCCVIVGLKRDKPG